MEQHYNRKIVIIIIICLLLLGSFFLLRWIVHSLRYVSTEDAQVKGNLVGVSTKVAARVMQLPAEEGHSVKKGELLALLDDRELGASFAQSKAAALSAKLDEDHYAKDLTLRESEAKLKIGLAGDTLSSSRDNLTISMQDLAMQEETARAEVQRQQAALAAAEANFTQAQAALKEAQRDKLRADQLVAQGAISLQNQERATTRQINAREAQKAASNNIMEQRQLFDIAKSRLRTIQMKQSAYQAAQSSVATSTRNLKLAGLAKERVQIDRETLKLMDAKRLEAEAKARYYQVLLDETRVLSPVNGSVAKRNINLGEVTTPGVPLFYVLDTDNLWIVANIQEGYIHRVKTGASARLKVDAWPGKIFKGRVEFIGAAASSEFSVLPSDNPAGNFIKVTHRIPVRVKVEDPGHQLKPGMNVVVDIRS